METKDIKKLENLGHNTRAILLTPLWKEIEYLMRNEIGYLHKNKSRLPKTSLCALAGDDVHFTGLYSRIRFVVPRQRIRPQTAKCPEP